jgi:hypothetical protein
LCDRNVDTLLGSSTSNKTRWLRRARISRKTQDASGHRQIFLTSFFKRDTPTEIK